MNRQTCPARAIVWQRDDAGVFKQQSRCMLHAEHDGEHVGAWAEPADAPRWSGDFAELDRS